MKKTTLFLIASLFTLHASLAQPERMSWFQDARLGIFIHWGIYAVNGIDESWSFYNEYLPYAEYMKQLDEFTAANYDPAAWAALIKESGAKYAVLTSKHHDGIALWDTKAGDLSMVKATPASRDLVGPFCEELRAKGIKAGLYYSLLDWSHPDYPNFTINQKRYDRDSVPDRWENFVRFNMAQITEVMTQYNPDLVWFDGDWEQSAEAWHAAEINLIIRIFADVIGMGGNLLLDIGPKPDGTIPEEQVQLLKELGRWTSKHSEAIYGTHAGIPKDCYYGPSTLSADSTVLYLFIHNNKTIEQSNPTPTVLQSYSPTVLLKGITNKISAIWVVGNGTKLEQTTWLKPWWSGNPGLIEIEVPVEAMDTEMTVIAVLLDGKIHFQF